MLRSHPQLFSIFIVVLHFQLREVSPDFFVDIVSRDNFLTTTLHILFSNIRAAGPGKLDRGLVERAAKFTDYLSSKFKWDFDEEPADWEPTLVQ